MLISTYKNNLKAHNINESNKLIQKENNDKLNFSLFIEWTNTIIKNIKEHKYNIPSIIKTINDGSINNSYRIMEITKDQNMEPFPPGLSIANVRDVIISHCQSYNCFQTNELNDRRFYQIQINDPGCVLDKTYIVIIKGYHDTIWVDLYLNSVIKYDCSLV